MEKGACVISIAGNLALTETSELERYIQPILRDSGVKHILLNFKNVEIIDSRGVGLLAAILKDLEDQKKTLILCHLNKAIQGILESLQLNKIIPIKPTEAEALAAIG